MNETSPNILEYVSPVDDPVPGCIRFISIAGIALGGITLLNRLVGLVAAIAMPMVFKIRQPVGFQFSLFSSVSELIFTGFAVWLIIASIACLKHLQWGRLWLVRYAVIYCLALLLDLAQAMAKVASAIPKMMAHPHAGLFLVTFVGGSIFVVIISAVLPAFIVIYMRGTDVRAVFRS